MSTSTKHEVSYHAGMVLMRLSDFYPTLLDALLEMIQNGIDANSTRVYVGIDLAARKRSAVVMNNGDGITIEKFDEALKSVGSTIKDQALPGTLGKFGLGLVSPLTKVTKYRLSSLSPEGVVNEWVFNPASIKEMADTVYIPRNRLARLPVAADVWGGVTDWCTVSRLEGLITDRTKSRISLDEFRDKVHANFGEVMRKRGILIKIHLINKDGVVQEEVIEPVEYTGLPFDAVTYTELDAGDVTFRLFRALPKAGGKPAGKIKIGQTGDLYSITWSDFARQVRARRSAGAWLDALGSGFFEGEITASNIKLAPERTKFEWDDALLGLYITLEQWYEEVGKPYLDKAREEHRNDRNQTLGRKSAEKAMVWLDENPLFRDAVKDRFAFGTIGTGHNTPSGGVPDGDDAHRVSRGGPKKPRCEGSSGRSSEGTDKDRPDDVPVGTAGPRGQQRKFVENDSQGLILVHEPLDSLNLWELDETCGKLYFNTSHQLWAKCEPQDSWILHLQDYVIMQVFFLLIAPAEQFMALRSPVDEQLAFYVQQFIINK